MNKTTVIIGLILAGTTLSPAEAAFQSAVITLTFPHGARSYAMGEVGTALADDESVAYWNPAGLGIENPRWEGVAGTKFREVLLPALKLRDLYHDHIGVCYQPKNGRIGGIALDLNHISFGETRLIDEEGHVVHTFSPREYVYSLSWGFGLQELGIRNHFWGLTFKYFHSSLIPFYNNRDTSASVQDLPDLIPPQVPLVLPSISSGDGDARGFALDIGYIWQFSDIARFAFTTTNMGPSIFYSDPDAPDPIPFTLTCALGLAKEWQTEGVKIVEVKAENRISRELAGRDPERKVYCFLDGIYYDLARDSGQSFGEKFREELVETQINFGGEVTIMNTGSARIGFLWDWIGERYELHWGLGFKLFNHIQIDFHTIVSPEGFMSDFIESFTPDESDTHREGSHGVRNGQWGFTISLLRMGVWSEEDFKWWIAEPKADR